MRSLHATADVAEPAGSAAPATDPSSAGALAELRAVLFTAGPLSPELESALRLLAARIDRLEQAVGL